MRTRRLSLQRETLTALATDELALVVAGVPDHTIDLECVTEWVRSTPCILAGPPHTREITCHSNPCTS